MSPHRREGKPDSEPKPQLTNAFEPIMVGAGQLVERVQPEPEVPNPRITCEETFGGTAA